MEPEDKKEEEKTETEVEVDEKFVGAVAEKVAPAVIEGLKEPVADAVKTAMVEGTEKTIKKSISDDGDEEKAESGDAGDDDEGGEKKELTLEQRAVRFARAMYALKSGDSMAVREYNKAVIAERQKAGYQNIGVDAQGGSLVPDPEFDTAVYENLPRYGVAFQYADIRQTSLNAVKKIALTADVAFTETGEAANATAKKLSFDEQTVTLRKFIAIVPATSELDEDSAIAYWNMVTQSLARAYAKVADQLVFTDSSSGIIETSGVIVEVVASATGITWDDLLNAENALEDGIDTAGFAFYMRRATWNLLCQLKGTTNDHYLFQPNPKNPATPWGTPIRFTRVLDKPSELGTNDAYAVFGDLKNFQLISKRGMEIEMLTEATINDTDGSSFNLALQDAKAMKARVRLLGVLPKGNAGKFVILGTGTVS